MPKKIKISSPIVISYFKTLNIGYFGPPSPSILAFTEDHCAVQTFSAIITNTRAVKKECIMHV